MTDTPKPVAQDTPSAQPRELSFSDLEPWLEWPTGARLLPDIDPETALARIEQAFGLKRGALLERLALDAALRSAQQILGPPKLRGMEICRDGLGISEEALRAASDPKTCPVCKRPGHATETDEYGRHRECQGADAATPEDGEVQPVSVRPGPADRPSRGPSTCWWRSFWPLDLLVASAQALLTVLLAGAMMTVLLAGAMTAAIILLPAKLYFLLQDRHARRRHRHAQEHTCGQEPGEVQP